MKTSLIRLVLGITLAAFLAVGTPAQAGLVGNATVLDAPANLDRDAALARVQATLARQDVRDRLEAWGVDPVASSERVAALSDSELSRLAADIDSAPAGGILALIGAVFVVLIILDYTGVTHVFRHR
ncbi:MAG: hypothetical protein RLZZ200_1389 [Pseudomonadota bacterium]